VVLCGDGISCGIGGTGIRKGLGIEIEQMKASVERHASAQVEKNLT